MVASFEAGDIDASGRLDEEYPMRRVLATRLSPTGAFKGGRDTVELGA
jgi:hypothetical protein